VTKVFKSYYRAVLWGAWRRWGAESGKATFSLIKTKYFEGPGYLPRAPREGGWEPPGRSPGGSQGPEASSALPSLESLFQRAHQNGQIKETWTHPWTALGPALALAHAYSCWARSLLWAVPFARRVPGPCLRHFLCAEKTPSSTRTGVGEDEQQ